MKLKPKKIWIISDTHFNHQFMINKWIRPDSYQWILLMQWHKYVGRNDTIIHLWDVIFSRPSELWWILNKLPGYKILVKGNHDKNKDNWYLSQWFHEVHEEYFMTFNWDDIIHLTHKPIITKHAINVSWHLHNYKWNNTFRHPECLNLNYKSRVYSCELENYKPILLIEIIKDTHQSAQYIKKKWWLYILKWYYLNKLLKKYKQIYQSTKVFLTKDIF